MNDKERLDLKKMVKNMSKDYEDNTEGIRASKHSLLIHADIMTMEKLKVQYAELRKSQPEEFTNICRAECSFLFLKYMDIFNRVLKDELDLSVMAQALATLRQIEDGAIDQQEGSVIAGKLFHKMYVDSALKRSANLDAAAAAADGNDAPIVRNAGQKMSWKDYKKKQD